MLVVLQASRMIPGSDEHQSRICFTPRSKTTRGQLKNTGWRAIPFLPSFYRSCRITDAIIIKLYGHVSNPFSYDRPHVGQRQSCFTEVTIDAVRKLLTSMPAKFSSVDFIPTSVVKACPELFAEIIAKLANLSFGEGRFPNKFR